MVHERSGWGSFKVSLPDLSIIFLSEREAGEGEKIGLNFAMTIYNKNRRRKY
jgi:hypothetical protein